MNDAVTLRVRSGILEQTGATAAVLQSDTMDHYRTFHMLERLLHAPPKLLHQLIFQIPPSRQALLIERCDTIYPLCWLKPRPREGWDLPSREKVDSTKGQSQALPGPLSFPLWQVNSVFCLHADTMPLTRPLCGRS